MTNNTTNLKSLGNSCYLYSSLEPFQLVSGQSLKALDLAFEMYGEFNSDKSNVILVHHSLSMSAHAANMEGDNNSSFDYDHKNNSGWWDNMIGPGKPLDTNKYCIICINNLGSCFGSTGPSNYSDKFPTLTMHDIVNSQKLLLDYLGISKLKLVIGSSMGGMLSLTWLQSFPDTLERLFVAACSHKAYPVNIFNRMIQQEIIKLAGNNTKEGMRLARMLGYFNYRSLDELNSRFSDPAKLDTTASYQDIPAYKNTELYSYFSYNSDKFAESFDKESYLCLLNAMDLFNLSQATDYHPSGYTQINSNVKITVASISTDILFPKQQQQDVYNLLVDSGYEPEFIEHSSQYGHDAFLVEADIFGKYISDLLNRETTRTPISIR